MNRLFLHIIWMLCICISANAQLLPDNNNLNTQSVARWMHTNRDIAPIIQAIESIHTTDAAVKAFEALAPAAQDQKIIEVLTSNNLLAAANHITQQHGWKSVGEYMRFSTKLGNAIAAYFLLGDLGKMTREQQQQLKEKADPAILAVPTSDIDFIKRNERTLQKYIQAYAAGR